MTKRFAFGVQRGMLGRRVRLPNDHIRQVDTRAKFQSADMSATNEQIYSLFPASNATGSQKRDGKGGRLLWNYRGNISLTFASPSRPYTLPGFQITKRTPVAGMTCCGAAPNRLLAFVDSFASTLMPIGLSLLSNVFFAPSTAKWHFSFLHTSHNSYFTFRCFSSRS